MGSLKTAQDYYPFGMLMPERNSNSDTYRFGYNGQEKDNEISGSGNMNTALFWEYDTRLGRRWNRDPKPTVGISDYACFRDNPIWFNDILGDSTWTTQTDKKITVNTTIELTGNALYNKKGDLRKDAQAKIDELKDDIKSKWDKTEYKGKEIEVNLITKTSSTGGTEKSYDQIELKRGGRRSFVTIQKITANGILKDYNVVKGSIFYTNRRTGTAAHEYGHMIGYFMDDYIESTGEPKEGKMRNSIMRTPYGAPLEYIFDEIFKNNPPQDESK